MKKPKSKPKNARAPSIVLAMMVRNERHVIRRAIESALPAVSSYFIVDTGSTDDTIAVASDALAGVPGEIVSRPWVGYGQNRSELLELARSRGDWLLLLDADEVLEVGGLSPNLVADAYELPILEGSIVSHRVALVRAARPWSYVGDLREVLVCEENHTLEPTGWGRIIHYEDGAESQRDQYERRMGEARQFRGVLDEKPHDARAAFHWADSLRRAGDLQGAISAFEYRVALGGAEDETFWALYQIAVLHNRRARLAPGQDPIRDAVVAGMFLRAHSFRPSRAEPLVALADLFGERGEWQTARLFAEHACSLPCVKTRRHPDRFAVDSSVLDWRAQYALARACFSTGDRLRAAELWAKIETLMPVEIGGELKNTLGVRKTLTDTPSATETRSPARSAARKAARSGAPSHSDKGPLGSRAAQVPEIPATP